VRQASCPVVRDLPYVELANCRRLDGAAEAGRGDDNPSGYADEGRLHCVPTSRAGVRRAGTMCKVIPCRRRRL
jgi:hypothetical protein